MKKAKCLLLFLAEIVLRSLLLFLAAFCTMLALNTKGDPATVFLLIFGALSTYSLSGLPWTKVKSSQQLLERHPKLLTQSRRTFVIFSVLEFITLIYCLWVTWLSNRPAYETMVPIAEALGVAVEELRALPVIIQTWIVQSLELGASYADGGLSLAEVNARLKVYDSCAIVLAVINLLDWMLLSALRYQAVIRNQYTTLLKREEKDATDTVQN